MSNDDFSDGSNGPNAGPFGSIPLMAPPPTFNPLVPGGLPPPNPGRASGASKTRTRKRYNAADSGASGEGDAPKASREPPMPGMMPPLGAGMSVFTPAFVPAPLEPSSHVEATEQPASPAAVNPSLPALTEPVTNETAESIDNTTAAEDSVVTDAPSTDGWDPEGGPLSEPAVPEAPVDQDQETSNIPDSSNGWDPEGGSNEGFGWDPEGAATSPDGVGADDSVPIQSSIDPEGSALAEENVEGKSAAPEVEEPLLVATADSEPVEPPMPGKKKGGKKKKSKKRNIAAVLEMQDATYDEPASTEVAQEDDPPLPLSTPAVDVEGADPLPSDEVEPVSSQVESTPAAAIDSDPPVDGWGIDESDAFGENAIVVAPSEEKEPVDVVDHVSEDTVPDDIAPVDELPAQVPKTRKKKKRVGDNTEVPDQPHFNELESSSSSSAPAKKGKKTKKAKGKKATHPSDVSAQVIDNDDTAVDEQTPVLVEDELATETTGETVSSTDVDYRNGEAEEQGQSTEAVAFAEEEIPSEPSNEEYTADLVDPSAEIDAPDTNTKAGKKKKKVAGKKSSAKVEHLQQQLDTLLAENATLKSALSNPETRAELITQDVLSELEHLRQLAVEQQDKIEQLLAQIEDLQQGRSSMSSSGSESDADRLSALEAQNQDLRRMHDAAVNLRDEITADKKRLQEHVAQLSADLDRLRKEQEASKRETQTLQEQCRELVEKWNSYRETLDSEKKSASADLDAAQRERERLASERSALDLERQQLRRAQEDFAAEKAISLTNLAREREIFDQARQQLDRELEGLQVQLEVFEKEKSSDPQFRGLVPMDDLADTNPAVAVAVDSSLQSELEDLRTKLVAAERRLLDDSSDEKIAELNRTIQELVDSHRRIEESRSIELTDLKRRYDAKIEENRTLQGELDDVCQRLDLVEKDNAELRDDLQKDRKRAGENLKHWHEKTSLLQQEVDSLAENNKALVHQKEDLLRQLEDLKSSAQNSPQESSTSTAVKKAVKVDSFGGWDDFDDFEKPNEEEATLSTTSSAEVENLKSEIADLQAETKGLYELVQKYEQEIVQLSDKLSFAREEEEALRAEALAMRQQLDQSTAQPIDAEFISQLEAELALTKDKCAGLQTQVSELQLKLDEQVSENAIIVSQQTSAAIRLSELERQLMEAKAFSTVSDDASLDALQADNENLKHKNERLENELNDLTEKLAQAEKEILSQIESVESLRSELAEKDTTLQTHHNSSADLIEKLAEAEREIENQMDLVESLRTQLAERANAPAPDAAPSEELIAKLGDSEQEIQRQMDVIDNLRHQLTERDNALVQREQAAEVAIKSLQEQLSQAQHEIEAYAATTSALRTQLESTKAQTQSEVAKPNQAIGDADGWDAEFEDDFGDVSSAKLVNDRASGDLEKTHEEIRRLESLLSQREIELQDLKDNFQALQETQTSTREELQQRLLQMENLETSSEEQRARLEAEILELKTSLASARERPETDAASSSRIAELEQTILELQAQIESARAFESEASKLQSELELIKQASQDSELRFISEIETLQEQLSHSSNAADLDAQVADLSRKLQAKTEQLKESIATNDDYMSQIGTLSKQVKQLTSQHQAQLSTIAQLETTLQEKDSDLDALNDDLEANNKRIQELQSEVHAKTDMLTELEASSARAIEELEAQVERSRQELERIRGELSQAQPGSISDAEISSWEAKLAEAENRRATELAALNQELEEVRMTSRGEIDQLMTQLQHVQETNSRISAELQSRDVEITEKASALRDIQEQLRSMEERYKEQVIAADQFMTETSSYRKQIKKLTDANDKLLQENGNLSNQVNALQKDFESAKHRIHDLDEKLRDRTGASDAQATELSAIATRLKAELISLQQQRDNEILAKDQEIERIRIEKQEEYERLSMQIQDLFREREETNIRVESASAEVSRATSRSIHLQRELEAARTEAAMTLRALQTEKDALEEALQSSQLKVTALEAESATVNAELQGRAQELADSLSRAREDRDRLEQTLLSLEKTFAEEKMSFERTNSDHVAQLLAFQRQNEELSIRLAEETERSSSAITNLTQRLEQLQAHHSHSDSDPSALESLRQQISDKDSLIQSLLKEKDELVQRLVVSTQDASSPVDRIVAAKEELEIQLFRMQESLRLAAVENAALKERLQVETQRDQVTKLTTAVEILKREKEELTKQLNSLRSGAAESETVLALRAEKQQLSQLLFSKTLELEEVSRERAALLKRVPSQREAAAPSVQNGPTKGDQPPVPADQTPKPAAEGTTSVTAAPTSPTSDEKQDPNQPGWSGVVSGVWGVIWGTD